MTATTIKPTRQTTHHHSPSHHEYKNSYPYIYHPFDHRRRGKVPFSSITLHVASTEVATESEVEVDNKMKVVQLARYPVKGLAPDLLSEVHISSKDFISTFPDDRRFALLQQKQKQTKQGRIDMDEDQANKKESSASSLFNPIDPKWIHKEHFLCAFTQPEFMAKFDCKYRIIAGSDTLDALDDTTDRNTYSFCRPNDDPISVIHNDNGITTGTETIDNNQATIHRMITIFRREYDNDNTLEQKQQRKGGEGKEEERSLSRSSTILLGPVDLSTSEGRKELETFFMEQYLTDAKMSHHNDEQQNEEEKEQVVPVLKCITAMKNTSSSSNSKIKQELQQQHVHQFGNTRSGVKNNNNDTRTIHIINEETVKELSSELGIQINPMRFRPNLIINGLRPWKEFDLVGKTLKVVSSPSDKSNENNEMKIEILSTTVRCAGVGIDPTERPDERNKLDIPTLLNKHYPQYGPYLSPTLLVM